MQIVGWGNGARQINAFMLEGRVLYNWWFFADISTPNGDAYVDSRIDSGRWTHLAATYDGSSRSIWINGYMVASDNAHRNGALLQDQSTFCVGYRHPGMGGTGSPFIGSLADLRIYDYGYSDTDDAIMRHLAQFAPPSTLVYSLPGITRLDGTQTCATHTPDASVLANLPSKVDTTSGEGYTVDFWLWADPAYFEDTAEGQANNKAYMILSWGDWSATQSSSAPVFAFRLKKLNAQDTTMNNFWWTASMPTTAHVLLDGWHHIVLSSGTRAGEVEYWVDGTPMHPSVQGSATQTLDIPAITDLCIGAGADWRMAQNDDLPWRGAIMDLKVYKFSIDTRTDLLGGVSSYSTPSHDNYASSLVFEMAGAHSFAVDGDCYLNAEGQAADLPLDDDPYTITAWIRFDELSDDFNNVGGIVGWGNYGTTGGANALRLAAHTSTRPCATTGGASTCTRAPTRTTTTTTASSRARSSGTTWRRRLTAARAASSSTACRWPPTNRRGRPAS